LCGIRKGCRLRLCSALWGLWCRICEEMECSRVISTVRRSQENLVCAETTGSLRPSDPMKMWQCRALCSGRRILLRYRRSYIKLLLGNGLNCRPPNNWSRRHDSKRSLSNRLWPEGLLCNPAFTGFGSQWLLALSENWSARWEDGDVRRAKTLKRTRVSRADGPCRTAVTWTPDTQVRVQQTRVARNSYGIKTITLAWAIMPASLIKMRTVLDIRLPCGPRVADGSSCRGGYLSNRPRLSACI
jgi:hypothetical protein